MAGRNVWKLFAVFLCLSLLPASVVFASGGKEKSGAEGTASPGATVAASGQETQLTPEGYAMPINQKPKKHLRIAILGLENNPAWMPTKAAAADVNKELSAYDTSVDWIIPAEFHESGAFGRAIEDCLTKKYDAIATLAPDAGIVPFINKAVESGVPVATFNVETKEPNKRLFFVGADLYAQGQMAGEAMAKALGGKGKVAVITGFFSVEGLELRRNGFLDTIKQKYPNIQIVGQVENHDQGDEAFNQTKDFMTANPDLAGVYVTAGGPFGAGKAVVEAGKIGVVKVVCFDFVDETMDGVKNGSIYATIGQDMYAQGHDPAVRLYNYLVAGIVPKDPKLFTHYDVVTKDNVDKYYIPGDPRKKRPAQ